MSERFDVWCEIPCLGCSRNVCGEFQDSAIDFEGMAKGAISRGWVRFGSGWYCVVCAVQRGLKPVSLCQNCGKFRHAHRDGMCYPDTDPNGTTVFKPAITEPSRDKVAEEAV